LTVTTTKTISPNCTSKSQDVREESCKFNLKIIQIRSKTGGATHPPGAEGRAPRRAFAEVRGQDTQIPRAPIPSREQGGGGPERRGAQGRMGRV
jgi:hypothetical protein